MDGHEMVSAVESFNSGDTWHSVALPSNNVGALFFIDTGNATTSRGTWLWISEGAGTWRTTNSGVAWTQVDTNQSIHNTSIYQPDKSGVVFMAGFGSTHGNGVLRSADYGQTWNHVGTNDFQLVVNGTPKNVYAMYGYPIGAGGSVNPAFELAAQPGTGTWVTPGTPGALSIEGAAQITVVNDGTHNILVGAMWNSGVWRYVEP
jgi:hypothetical protein